VNTRIAIAAACLLAGAGVQHADGYTTFGEWSGSNFTLRGATVSFPVGVWRSALQTVETRFDVNPSNSYMNHSWNDGSVGIGNGQSEVWFSSDSAHSPAVTYTSTLFGFILEADVVFYNGIAYTTSMNKTSIWPYGGASRPFQTTACHEYGHAAGLGHENDEYNIMGQDWDHIHCNGSSCRSYFGEDACDGLVALYGRWSGGSIEDVSVSMFRYTGASGAYSTHGLCRMWNSTGGALSSVLYNGQRRYNVNSGQTVRVEFTYENNGETSKTPRVGFYLSTNSTISTGDTLITTRNPTVARGNVYTTYYTITLPAGTSGTIRFLGVIIDDNGLIAEVDSSNNAAYHIIKYN